MAHHRPQNQVEFLEDTNSRGLKEIYVKGKHISIEQLKTEMQVAVQRNRLPSAATGMYKNYLTKDIPEYPTPVVFEVANVAHDTNKRGLAGILRSEMFRPPSSEYSWWNLNINSEERKSAETEYLKKNAPHALLYPPKRGNKLLEKFTTSPLFQLEKSRYGNYRFVFPLAELMQLYKEQNCKGLEPVLRVYKTLLYKQEIVYAVLIHSPEKNELFGEYPLLEESDWVQYQNEKICWKAQAICGTHKYKLNELETGKARSLGKRKQYYVWDQVSLVFHLPKDTQDIQALKIPGEKERLIQALLACERDEIDISGEYRRTEKLDKEKLQEQAKEAKEEVLRLKMELQKIKAENEEEKTESKRPRSSQVESQQENKKREVNYLTKSSE